MRLKLAFILAVSCLLMLFITEQVYAESNSMPTGYILIFEDNFDGSVLNTSVWKPTDSFTNGGGAYGWFSGYGQEFWDHTHIAVTNGNLFLSATSDMHSGEIRSIGTWGYGYFECRARLPNSPGFWPAFWTLSSLGTYQEIDISEDDSSNPYRIGMNIHWTITDKSNGEYIDPNTDFQKDFHTYGVLYLPEKIEFYVDGVLRRSFIQQSPPQVSDPMQVRLSLSIFGPNQTWANPPDSTTVWPGTLLVDWVRIWQEGMTPSDTTAPVVTILSPMTGTTIPRKASTTILADATDNVGVTRVEFWVNGALKYTATAAPYTFVLEASGKPNASYRVDAKAFDAAGNSSTATVTVIAR